MSLVRDAQGRVRAPYVIGVFIVIAVTLEIGLGLILSVLGLAAYRSLEDTAQVLATASTTLVAAVAATLVSWLWFREPTGLNDSRLFARFGAGFLMGALALTLSCVVPALVGATTLSLTTHEPAQVVSSGLRQLIALGPAGFGEELLMHGLGFQALRRGVGDVAAVIVSSLVFGGLHLSNPNASLIAALAIALVGVWFGALTIRTGSLWAASGVHVAWNFFEGFVFGQPVSGAPPGSSLFVGPAEGAPGFWSGGAFGPEAAGWTAVVLSLAIVLTLFLPRRDAGNASAALT